MIQTQNDPDPHPQTNRPHPQTKTDPEQDINTLPTDYQNGTSSLKCESPPSNEGHTMELRLPVGAHAFIIALVCDEVM